MSEPVVPRTARGERTRRRLLDAARTSFGHTTWARARVEDVCREAGVGHGTFYAYFPNRTAILEALVRRHATALYRLVEAPWTSGDARADVRAVIAGFTSLVREDADIRTLWAAAAVSEPPLADLEREVRTQFARRIAANLAGAVESGLARDGLDVDIVATALGVMVEQTALLGGPLVGPPAPPDRLADVLTDLWVHAVYRDAVTPGGIVAAWPTPPGFSFDGRADVGAPPAPGPHGDPS
ncbi:MAG TPA: TetR/AcrR family transcriptional regulator [Mycobacteriales bacterium]|jgi:AcrR family transcriptional regulator